MAGFSSKLQDEAIGKAQLWPRTEKFKSGGHDIRVLEHQLVMIEQHFDCGSEFAGAALIHSGKHPGSFCEGQNRYPGAWPDKLVSGSSLAVIVSGNQPNQNIGINGAHNA